jgi:hypothetical protein
MPAMILHFLPSFRKWVGLWAVGVCLSLACLPSPAWGEKTRIYTYDILKVEGHRPLTLIVEPKDGKVLITYYNEFGDREISAFDSSSHILYAQYFNALGQETAHVSYDYAGKKIYLVGLHNAVYNLAPSAYENNGSLFHLFTFLYPAPGKEVIFRLTQGNLSHINDEFQRLLICKLVGPIDMFLRSAGTEMVEAGGKRVLADHYELGIHDRLLASFWPAVYDFWYSVDEPRLLVKYRGMNPKHEVETITLIDYVEHDNPPPPADLPGNSPDSTAGGSPPGAAPPDRPATP